MAEMRGNELELTHTVAYGVVEYVGVKGGQAHERYVIKGRSVDDGRCNLDDAARASILSREEVASWAKSRLCRFCFPSGSSEEPV